MGVLGTAVIRPSVDAGTFGVLFGAEDNTSGTAFVTSDQSGYAHVGYARVDVPTTGTTIGGTVYGTSGTARNNLGIVAPTGRILNFFPNSELTQISIRRGRTRPDQYDDVGELTVTVNNQYGSSDPDNTTGRYQQLNTITASISNVTNAGGTITYTAQNSFTAGDIIQITNVNPTAYNIADAVVANPTSTSFQVVNAGTGTYVSGGYATKNNVYSSFLKPGMFGQVVLGASAGTSIPLFTGVLEQVEPTDDRWSTATYTFVDRIASIGRATMVNGSKVGANGDTGAQRLALICQAARLYDIYNGNGGTNLVEQVIDIRGFTDRIQLGSVGDTALDCIKTIVDGQAGRVFSNRSGVICMWDRANMQTSGTTMAGTFTDKPGTVAGFGYDEIHTNQAQNFLYNAAVVNAGSAIVASARQDLSIAQYGERRQELNTCLLNASDALTLANFAATNYSNPSTSVSSISVQAYAFSQSSLETLASIDLQQGVRVYRQLPGGRVLDVNCVVEGIEIDLSPSTRRFTFYLSPRDTVTTNIP